mgnify:CR=1 FL=1
MGKDKEVQILEYKIAELKKKIANFELHKISEKKIESLRLLKLKYETQLEEILAGVRTVAIKSTKIYENIHKINYF